MNDHDFSAASDFGTPFAALVGHCENRDLKFRANRKKQRISMSLRGRHVLYHCRLHVSEDDTVFQIHLSLPVFVDDKEMRAAAAEFFTRANYGLVIGHFEFDMSDGEVRYHIGHVMPDRRLDDDTITRLISTALFTADRYFPTFMQLVFGGSTAEDAVFLAELDAQLSSIVDDGDQTPTLEAEASEGGKLMLEENGIPAKPADTTQEAGKTPPAEGSDQKDPGPPSPSNGGSAGRKPGNPDPSSQP